MATNENNDPPKVRVQFNLSEQTDQMLRKMAEDDDQELTAWIKFMIRDEWKRRKAEEQSKPEAPVPGAKIRKTSSPSSPDTTASAVPPIGRRRRRKGA